MAASYFDVDGTLIRSNLIHPTVYYMVNQASPLRSLGRLARGFLGAPALALAELRDRPTFNELLYALYEGITEDRLLTLADETFERVVKPELYPGARDLVARCKARGHEVVFVSGSLDLMMDRLGALLGADHVICNRLELHGGVATGKLLRPVVAGPEKARLVREHARARGHDLNECFAYSDSYSDVPMLSVVGSPAAVNPDAALARLARAYQWPVLDLERRS